MAELLHVEITEGVRSLRSPEPVLDPVMQRVVEQAVTEAARRGYVEGEAAGRQAASAAAAEIAGRLDAVLGELLAQRDAARTADLELAVVLATAVLGATPPPDALALLDRARAAAEVLDDDPLEVHLHPDDHAALGETPLDRRLRTVPDAAVARGDVRLVGAWGGAELTREALLRASADLHAAGLPPADPETSR